MTTKIDDTGDSRQSVSDQQVTAALNLKTSQESQKHYRRFHQVMHAKLSAAALPRQRVHDHAMLYLVGDTLQHYKEVAELQRLQQQQIREDEFQQQQQQQPPKNNNNNNNNNDNTKTSSSSPNIQKSFSPEDDLVDHPPNKAKAAQSSGGKQQQHDGATATIESSQQQQQHHHHQHPTSLSIVEISKPSDRVLVINVGGTLGMCPGEEDGLLRPKARFLLEQMLNLHELRFPEVPVFDFIEYNELVDSSDMSGRTWEMLARDIYEHYEDYCGFLVTHGTDTLHYTAAAMSFALEKLSKPVVLMGSMIPLSELYTDTRRNLTAALRFAGCGNWLNPGVYVFFHEQLFYGTRCVKMNDSLKAFDSPNSAPAADLNTLRFIRSHAASLSQQMMNFGQQQQYATTTNSAAATPSSYNNNHQTTSETDFFYQTLAGTSHITAPLQLRARFSDRVMCMFVVPDVVMSEAARLFSAETLVVSHHHHPFMANKNNGNRMNNNSKSQNNNNNSNNRNGIRAKNILLPQKQFTSRRRYNTSTTPQAIILKVPELNLRGSQRLTSSLQAFGATAAANGCAVFATSSSPSHGLSPSTIASLLRYAPDVVPLNDMLAETAVVKAMWLLGEMFRNVGSSSSGGGVTGGGGHHQSGGGGGIMGGGGGSSLGGDGLRKESVIIGGGAAGGSSFLENFKRLMFVNLRGEVTETAKMVPKPLWVSKL